MLLEDSQKFIMVPLELENVATDLLISEPIERHGTTDSILKGKCVALMQNTFPVQCGVTDNSGRSVAFIPLKKWKLDHIPKLVVSGDYLRFITSLYEALTAGGPEESSQENLVISNNHEFILIIDAQEFSSSSLLKLKVARHLSQFAKVLDSNYPGRLSRCIVINCNSQCNELLIKLVLKTSLWSTPSCIQFYQEPSSWIDVLRSFIPSEQLPLEYGGWRQL